MMGLWRRMAAGWLRLLTGLAPPDSRRWGLAMLAELEYLDADRAAIGWALGASVAIMRHSLAHAHPLRAVRHAVAPRRVRLVALVVVIALTIALLARTRVRSVSESRPVSVVVPR